MIKYIPAAILLIGFYYITFRNSPKHANILLLITAISVGISFIKPIQLYSLLGIVGVLIVMIQSRKVREKDVQEWFTENGFKIINIPFAETLFKPHTIGTHSYYGYSGEVMAGSVKISIVLAIHYNSYQSNKTVSIVYECSYYFSNPLQTDFLEKQFRQAQSNTPNTNFWKSQLGYFNLKKCEIAKPAMGGILVRWLVPHSVEGYNDRFKWIQKAINS